MAAPSPWLLWQLADSAFPAGGLGHSGGWEAAAQLGELRRGNLEPFLLASLGQFRQATLPLALEAHRQPARFAELDATAETFLTNHVARHASRQQGRSFLAAAEQSFGPGALTAFREQLLQTQGPGHFAPVSGVVLRLLEVDTESAVRLLLFNQLRSWLAAAVRLGVVGPLEAQRCLFRVQPAAEETARASLALTLDDLAQTAPLLDLWQGVQDRLYSRLFQT